MWLLFFTVRSIRIILNRFRLHQVSDDDKQPENYTEVFVGLELAQAVVRVVQIHSGNLKGSTVTQVFEIVDC